MSVKDFFIAVIRIMAIYFFIEAIFPLMAQIIVYGYDTDSYLIFVYVGVILLFFALFYLMISNAKGLVKFLRLDRGFSTERFDFSKADGTYIIEIAIAIMGIYMLICSIPYILMDGYALFKSNINSNVFSLGENTRDLQSNLITNFLYILVGLVILFLRKPIANIFTTKPNEE
ncbi:hypothetical protein KORDIASMS9_03435 [Kordia sp. SMS9]|uniref:hypothetical protein n=1 Tax=Kordia sp. SMS9 TaxID=2282170 RepID=UPI000E0D0A4A|nr:hypothetical protein [Kordia sp. SMS9]AXG71179.1 hypothetical protein KORDIASMS9_03435 [Kordia sp. SMS9]